MLPIRMSDSEEKRGGATTLARSRWLSPRKLLSAALSLFMLLLIWTIDASVVTDRLGDYLGPICAATTTINNNRNTTTTTTISPKPPPPPTKPTNLWISVPTTQANFTATLLARWMAPGGDARTTAISLPDLDGATAPVELPAGDVHEFVIQALDDAGRARCLGGDYFETDLSGESWKSRPPVTDHGNGSYTFKLQVHPDFAGDYNLTIILLFRSFEGLKMSPKHFTYRRELRNIPIRFHRARGNALPIPRLLQLCRGSGSESDFGRNVWSGRWTRHARNDRCPIDHDGRFRCLDPVYPCERPWCDGPLGALESNGWVYSAHCSFRIFNQDSAWRCLRGRWLFFWGDSNHVDTIRNLLNFVLGLTEIKSVPRRFDMNFTNPRNSSETVRITSIFNGHWNGTNNYLGLQSLRNENFRQLLWRYFSEEERVPDTMIFNSGLHDGVYWKNIRAFSHGAEYAARFWEEVMSHVREKGKGKGKGVPRLFYRTTIATGGYARDLAFNPSKMEAFNGIFVEKLKEKGLLSAGGVIDDFDMTFPWHYDNRSNDGVHYGRPPAKARWRDGEVGHQYFVDLMLAHVLLNAICSG